MKAIDGGRILGATTDRHESERSHRGKTALVTSHGLVLRLVLCMMLASITLMQTFAAPVQETGPQTAIPVMADQDITQVTWAAGDTGVPVPEIRFVDGAGNVLGDGQLSAIDGVTMILERGADVPESWTLQFRTRSRAQSESAWTYWSSWELYTPGEPVSLETGRDHEVQIRYGIPAAVVEPVPVLETAVDSDGLDFALITADQDRGRAVIDGETVNFDVRVSLIADRTYVSETGKPLSARLWILKASEGTVIRSQEDVLLEVLEGFVGRFTVVTQFVHDDGTVAAESDAIAFTIDRRPPPPVVLVAAEYLDRAGNSLADGAITNSDVSLAIDIVPSEEGLRVQYRMDQGPWMDMTILDEDSAIARFTAANGETRVISAVELRHSDAAGNGSSSREYVAIPGIITIDKERPEPPALVLTSQGGLVQEAAVLNQPMKLAADIPEGERGGSFQFSYDENGDGVFTAWQELKAGSVQDFMGVEASSAPYTIRVRFIDGAGNISEIRERRVTIDLSRPAPPIWDLYDDKGIEMTDQRAVSIPVILTARSRQGSTAGFSYRYEISGKRGFTSWTPLDEGMSVRFEGERNASYTYNLELRAMSDAGNASETLRRTFTIDRQPPGTPIWNLRLADTGTAVANGNIVGKPVILYPSKPSDASPGVFEYQFIGGEQRVLTAWVPLSSGAVRRFEVPDGTVSDFTINIRYVDTVGNRSGISTRFFTIDRVGPAAPAWDMVRKDGAVPVDSADETNKGPVRLRPVSAKDDPGAVFQYQFRIDGGAWSEWAALDPEGFADFDGMNQESVVYDISIRYVDVAGNPGAVLTRSLIVDRDFPSPPTWDLRDSSGSQVGEGQVLSTPVTLYPVTPEYEFGGVFQFRSATSLDADYSVWQNLPEGSTYTFSGEADDDITYTIDIRYLDSAGNASTLLSRSFMIDRYPPAAPLWDIRDEAGAEVSNGLTVMSSVFLTAQPPSYESGGIYQYRFDDNNDGYFTAWQPLSIGDTVEFPGKSGERMRVTLQIRYIDKAGNSGSNSEMRFRIDRLNN